MGPTSRAGWEEQSPETVERSEGAAVFLHHLPWEILEIHIDFGTGREGRCRTLHSGSGGSPQHWRGVKS